MSHKAVGNCGRFAVNAHIKSSQICVAFLIRARAGLMWHERSDKDGQNKNERFCAIKYKTADDS